MALAILLAALVAAMAPAASAETLGVCRADSGTGWLERTDQGDLVLHMEGTYYDMGVQHATLLKDEARLAVRAAKHSMRIEQPLVPTSYLLKRIYNDVTLKQLEHTPAEFKEEMRGLADASGIGLELIQTLHSISYLTSCCGAAAFGPASADGKLYFMRSNDIAIAVDLLTMESYHDKGIIMIYKPETGVPFMMISWPGYIGASDGMNARGIAVGNTSGPTSFETPLGLPMNFRLKQTLAKAETLDEAVLWMSEKPWAGGYHFFVADAKIPGARVMEMDAKALYVGGWDGPAESNEYDFQGRHYSYEAREGLLIRTNHPKSDDLLAHRTRPIDEDKRPSRLTYPRYADLDPRLAGALGSLGLEPMMDIMRAHYNSLPWDKAPTLGGTSHQFVMDPKTGDFLISFAKGNPLTKGTAQISAFNQPVRRYNFFELLDRKPEQ